MRNSDKPYSTSPSAHSQQYTALIKIKLRKCRTADVAHVLACMITDEKHAFKDHFKLYNSFEHSRKVKIFQAFCIYSGICRICHLRGIRKSDDL